MPLHDYTLDFATLLDGSSNYVEQARDIAVDVDGSIYITGGTTASSGFPLTPGLDYKSDEGADTLGSGGDMDAFLTKLDADGNFVWSSRIGGTGYDRAYALELDDFGHVVIAGRAGGGLMTSDNSYQEDFGGDTTPTALYGNQDGFIAQFDTDTGVLTWATYLGGADAGFIRDIDISADGAVHAAMANVTGSVGQPITADAMDSTMGGTSDLIYASISSDGQTLLYGTYIGSDTDSGHEGYNPAIRVDNQGDINILMITDGDGMYTSPDAVQTEVAGANDVYLVKLDGATDGRTIKSATYFGGTGSEDLETHQLAVDADGNFVINLSTNSTGLTTTENSYLQNLQGGYDAYIAKISADGTTVLASTYFGDSGNNRAESIVVTENSIAIVGPLQNGSVPVTGTDVLGGRSAQSDGYIAVFDTDLTTLKFAETYGGSGKDTIRALAVDDAENIYFAGQTTSGNLPLLNGFDTSKDGTYAAFVGKLEFGNEAPVAQDFNVIIRHRLVNHIQQYVMDPEGDAYTIESVGQAEHGTVSFTKNGRLVYEAEDGFYGLDSFTYTIVDQFGATATGTVNVLVDADEIPDAGVIFEEGAVKPGADAFEFQP